MSLGGALAANIHGRGLRFRPIIADVEAFTLLDTGGRLVRCSRTQHADLFRLAIGGYGLFGVIASVRLRLAPRQKLQRLVELVTTERLMSAFARRIEEGCVYGDCQVALDLASMDFLRVGVLSCYRPVDEATVMPTHQRALSVAAWHRLAYLAHVDPSTAFARYAEHYLETSGQLYWSDLHQLSPYVGRYHEVVDRWMAASIKATEIITELYVPRQVLESFLAAAREDFRCRGIHPIYCTIRLIEAEHASFLAWAREPWVCLIFNLHTPHTPEGLARSREMFQRLIDRAIERGGNYYLTYHRFATQEQVAACYPQLETFLELKRVYDPEERLQSDWYLAMKRMV